MKIKKEFLIKGKLWQVEYKWGLRHEDGQLCDGLCDRANRIIWLRREASPEEKWQTFLHEVNHAIISECHIATDGDLKNELIEEIFCDAVADVMSDLFDIKWKRRA